ncbi:MAG TPA: Sec-independent protein translocase protein TatB [Gammaproteobacteria bacterium]|nr:Sec-independent protein translocase protein TatB [Gammaproteobacteria bacterium]
MFGVGSGELLLVFVIGLIVLGPERLPKVAAQVGRWVARARRMANQLRYQLEQEIALEELRAKNAEAAKSSSDLKQGSAQADGAAPRVESVASAEAENDAVPAGHDAMPVGDDAMPFGDHDQMTAGDDEMTAGDEEAGVEEAEAPVSPLPAAARPLGSAIAGTAPPSETRHAEVMEEDEAEVVTAEPSRSEKTGSTE